MNIYTFSGLIGFIWFIYLVVFIFIEDKYYYGTQEHIKTSFLLFYATFFSILTGLIIYGVFVV